MKNVFRLSLICFILLVFSAVMLYGQNRSSRSSGQSGSTRNSSARTERVAPPVRSTSDSHPRNIQREQPAPSNRSTGTGTRRETMPAQRPEMRQDRVPNRGTQYNNRRDVAPQQGNRNESRPPNNVYRPQSTDNNRLPSRGNQPRTSNRNFDTRSNQNFGNRPMSGFHNGRTPGYSTWSDRTGNRQNMNRYGTFGRDGNRNEWRMNQSFGYHHYYHRWGGGYPYWWMGPFYRPSWYDWLWWPHYYEGYHYNWYWGVYYSPWYENYATSLPAEARYAFVLSTHDWQVVKSEIYSQYAEERSLPENEQLEPTHIDGLCLTLTNEDGQQTTLRVAPSHRFFGHFLSLQEGQWLRLGFYKNCYDGFGAWPAASDDVVRYLRPIERQIERQ